VNNKSTTKKDPDIYVAALHNIFTAMKGCRIFERFGFNLPKVKKDGKSTLLNHYEEWEFDPEQFDWINNKDKNTLSGYIPSIELRNLLIYNVNTDSE
jgi:hypothetical protein